MKPLGPVPALVLLAVLLASAAPVHAASGQSTVLSHHGGPDRSGHFVVPALTWERARSLRLDQSFRPRVSGHVHAQPLYWRAEGAGAGVLIVATANNVVHAIDAASGNEIWQRSLGRPVPRSSLACGNIDPLGVTGTPVIDPSSEAVFLNAAVATGSGPRHLVYALRLRDGSVLPGWPVDVAEALGRDHRMFVPRDQNQRGALAILDGTVYVPFGGHWGDCGNYRGVVVGISIADPRNVKSWATRGRGGGIWAPGGIASDGHSLFVATGNTFGATSWSDGEAVFRLSTDLRRSDDKRDFFAPRDWRALDARDVDLGGANPLPLDVPGSTGKQALVLALGKDGKAYLLDRNDLGGIGGALASETVARNAIITVPATFPAADGVFVAFHASGARCPGGDAGLTALKITAGSPPKLATAWCGSLRGAGSATVTTTDGQANPIVWITGAEGDNRLHGFRGDTGEPLFTGPPMAGLRHFQAPIAAENRLYVAADGRIYAFELP